MNSNHWDADAGQTGAHQPASRELETKSDAANCQAAEAVEPERRPRAGVRDAKPAGAGSTARQSDDKTAIRHDLRLQILERVSDIRRVIAGSPQHQAVEHLLREIEVLVAWLDHTH